MTTPTFDVPDVTGEPMVSAGSARSRLIEMTTRAQLVRYDVDAMAVRLSVERRGRGCSTTVPFTAQIDGRRERRRRAPGTQHLEPPGNW